MKPLRSPRFQSAAERRSIAAISCGGLSSGIFGAEHATNSEVGTTYHAPRIVVSLTWPRERLVETLPRVSWRAGLPAAFLLGGFLFLLGLRLGRFARLLHRHGRWRRHRRGCRREHRFHEPRSGPTAVRELHLLKHRIFSYAGRCGGVVGGL